jgi:hypothetical protein
MAGSVIERDRLWLFGRPLLGSGGGVAREIREQLVIVMQKNARDASLVEDVAALAPAVRDFYGPGGVDAMVTALMTRAKDDATKAKLRELMKR